jgi:hypothetical protein
MKSLYLIFYSSNNRLIGDAIIDLGILCCFAKEFVTILFYLVRNKFSLGMDARPTVVRR